MERRYREKYSCIELALALIKRPGPSYGPNISRRQTKLTQPTESRVLPDPSGHHQPNVSHKGRTKTNTPRPSVAGTADA